MQVSATEISDLIRKKIENFEVRTEAQTEGKVLLVGIQHAARWADGWYPVDVGMGDVA